MLKHLYDRLSYALIGFIFGAVVATLLWLFFGAGLSRRVVGGGAGGDALQWLKYGGGFFALLGFVLKDRVGSVLGETVREVYDYETYRSGNPEVPGWVAALLLVGVVLGVWYFGAN